MIIVPFEPFHAAAIRPRETDRRSIQADPDLIERAESYAHSGPAFTLIDSGRVVGIGGFIVLHRGVACGWGMGSDELGRCPVSALRNIRRVIDLVMERSHLHRIEVNVDLRDPLVSWKDPEPRVRWLEGLGFTPEGICAKYGPDGTDYLRLARIKS